MAAAELVEELEEQIKTITRYKETELVRRAEWGDITFEVAAQDIDIARSIAGDLSTMPLSHLADQAAQNITAYIPNVAAYLQQIDEFKLQGNVEENRDSIAANLKAAVEGLLAAASQWIAYLAYKRGDLEESVKQTETALAEAKTKLDDANAYAATRRGEIDEIVALAREASASAGVATFTHEFDQEAKRLAAGSKKWLGAVVALAILTSVAALVSFYWPTLPSDANSWATLRHVVAKVSVIAVFFTGTIWCGRIYRALTHQRSINRHRALSLKTFQAFVQATDDPATRDAVLMAATKSIFGNVPTGFVDERGAPQDTSVNILEIGKSASKAARVPRVGSTQE